MKIVSLRGSNFSIWRVVGTKQTFIFHEKRGTRKNKVKDENFWIVEREKERKKWESKSLRKREKEDECSIKNGKDSKKEKGIYKKKTGKKREKESDQMFRVQDTF